MIETTQKLKDWSMEKISIIYYGIVLVRFYLYTYFEFSHCCYVVGVLWVLAENKTSDIFFRELTFEIFHVMLVTLTYPRNDMGPKLQIRPFLVMFVAESRFKP